tara:strand:- start:2609 stop:2848 length:240 start_codon:yes stop_codon:yes gene_type:complete
MIKKGILLAAGRESTWFDVDTTEVLSDAAEFINVTQHRNGYKIACLEEIAYQKDWINKSQLYGFVKFYQNSNYSKYIKK